MRNLHLASYMIGFILLFGAIFLAQCDTDTRTDRDQYSQEQEEVPQIGTDEEDRRHDGTGTEGTGAVQQDYTIDFEAGRDQLIQDIEELRDDLDEQLERNDLTHQEIEQIKNDRTELARTLREVQTSTVETWNYIRTEAQQSYDRIAARYDDGRPD